LRISVCFIVRNEEEHIARALRSIPDAFEVIVVDTGSEDKTVDIAQALGAKVFHYSWKDDFADARNYSISKATGRYILILDADETLHESFETEMEKHLQKYPDSPSTVLIENIDEQEKTRHHMVRFFPNTGHYYFHGIVHEQLFENQSVSPFVKSNMMISHFGYQKEVYDKKKKYEFYVRLYKQVLELEPDNGYMQYQLGKLHYSQKMYALAYEVFMSSLALEQYDKPYFPPMIVQLGYCLKEMGRHHAALELLNAIQTEFNFYPDLYFLIGLLYMETGNFEFMRNYFEQCLKIGETTQYSTVVGTGSYRAAHNLGVYFEVTAQLEEARNYYRMAAACNYQPSVNRLEELQKLTNN